MHEGQLAVRWVTTLSLSFDHRLVDGEQGSRFLADIAGILAAGCPAGEAGPQLSSGQSKVQ